VESNSDTPKQLDLSGERLSLFQALDRRSERIARMYAGAHLVLRESANTERLCCAAHLIRELMEKVPEIVDVRTQARQERMTPKARELEAAYDSALRKTQLRPPEWKGDVDSAIANLLETLREFVEWMKAHLPRRRDEILSTFRALDGPGPVLPPDLENEMFRAWMKMNDFFQSVSHHNQDPTNEQFDEQLRRLEGFLLKKLNPPTFPNFDAIDAIIEEGEGNDQR
jgi:hypothetical protein